MLPYSRPYFLNITDNSFTVIVRANKFQDIEYTFKYTLNDKDELDSIEYVSQEVVKDYTKEIEKKERIYLMVKEGDEIHKDNEYITVLQYFSYTPPDKELIEQCGIIDKLKEKKYKENILPIDNSIGCNVFVNKEFADYDKKEITIFVLYYENRIRQYKKYLISFDYDDNYYLTKYAVINSEDMSIDEFKKATGIRRFSDES